LLVSCSSSSLQGRAPTNLQSCKTQQETGSIVAVQVLSVVQRCLQIHSMVMCRLRLNTSHNATFSPRQRADLYRKASDAVVAQV
jgi:hypothetical protein